jgi:uncharacterized repeat protein (TIGR01451 family)/uncharacterized repeat protein (TIGR02543 family)
VIKTAIIALVAPLLITGGTGAPANAVERSTADEGYINPGPNSASTYYEAGMYIIDAGAHTGTSTQSINQGLKPYGLVYALVKAKIPVQWIIKSDKTGFNTAAGNDQPDISNYDCDGPGTAYASKNYVSGAFVISKDFAAAAKPIIDSWKSSYAGLTVDGPCTNTPTTPFPVFATIKSWPRAVLDTQNGSVAVAYYNNAGIAQGSTTDPNNPPAYRLASPTQLTPCDDMYIMPHADPTYATHSNLINFVKKGGDLYASCHAVSVLENIVYPAGHESATAKAMNFLTTQGTVLYSAHSSQGSPAYTLGSAGTTVGGVTPGDPVAQFLGKPDLAMQQGSEQIFIPSATIGGGRSEWRPSTRIISYDPTQANTNGGSAVTNPKQAAAAIAYGPAWGDINAGLVMYQGGHSVNKGTADDVAAQRAFWNFQLLAAVSSSAVPSASDRTPTVVMTESSTTAASVNSVIPVSGYAVGGSGSYKYSWASSCFKSTGEATTSGTFANANSADTTFRTPDVAGQINCNLTLTIIDTCGRFSFGYQTISVAPTANVRIAQSVSGTHTTATASTYTIVVTNDGAISGTTTGDGNYASSVKVTSLIPAGAAFGSVAISGSAPTGATCAQSMINGSAGWTCDLKDMTDEQVVTIILTLNPNAAGTLTNTVTANTLSYDNDLSDNVDSDNITVTEDVTIRPSLSMTKEPSVQQAGANGKVSFKLSVTNTTSGGDITLTNIVLTDNFNTLGTLTCNEGGRAVFDGATSGATYTIPSLARGVRWEAACTITGVFSSGSATTGTNTLYAAFSYGGTNYTATSGAVTINKANSLEITKTEEGALKPGGLITYRIRVYNPTSSSATNVVLTDTLPLGVTVESVTATNTNTSVMETATAKVIAWDKFNGNTTTTGQGWLASSWTLTTSGGTTPVLSSSGNTTGLSTPFTSERNSIMIKAASSEAPSFSRTVTLSREYKSVSVVFECSSQSTGPTLRVSMAGTEIFRGTCTNSRQQIVASVPSSVFTTAGSKELKFETVANTSTSTKAIFIDDIFVLGGFAAGDLFTGAYDSQQGMVASWTETDSNNYLGQKAIGTSGGWSGTSVVFKSSDSSNRATSKIEGNFYYDPARYAGATIAFTCSHSKDLGDSDKLVFKVGSTTVRTEGKSTSYCEKSSSNPSSDSAMKLDTFTVPSANLPSTAGNVKFTFEFTSKKDRDIAISDFFVLVREKGSSSVSVTYNTLAAALAGPYTLAAGEAKEISYTVRIPNPYVPGFLTGLVNTASVKSDQMANPAFSIISTPFAVSKLSVEKRSDKSMVASGGNVVYTYNVTNNGTTGSTIDTITVSDAGCSPVTLQSKNGDSSTVLGAGKTWTYTCTLTNLTSETTTVVSVSGVDNLGDPQSDDDALTVKVSSPSLTVTVSPAAKSIYAGNNVSYTYLVKNTGNVSLKNVGVTAANCPTVRYKSGDPNGDLELEAGDTWTFICTSPAITVSQTNQSVTARGTDVAIGTVVNSSPVTVAVTVYNRPVIKVTKTVKNTGPSPSGPASSISVLESNTVVYEYSVTVETATLSSVRVNDTGCTVPVTPTSGDTGTTSGVLEIGETWIFTCNAGKLLFSETATATVMGVDGLTNRVQSDEVSTYVEVVSPELLLSVTPNKEYIRKGATELYTYTITNIGGATFTGFTSVTDTNCALSLPDASTHSLAPGSTWTFTCSKAATGTSMLSQFNVTGTYSTAGGPQTYSPAEATYKVFVMDPAMTVQKLAQVYKGTSSETRTAGFQSSVTAAIGDTIVFKYIVTGGEGSIPEVAGINAIVLTAINDNDCLVSTFKQVKSNGYNVGDSNNSGAIDKNEPWEFTCTAKTSVTAAGTPTNTPIASPVTLDADTTLEAGSSGIGIRKGGYSYSPSYISAGSAVEITVVPVKESPSKKFTVAGASTAVKSFSVLASPAGKNLSETSSATITIDPGIQNYSLTYNANGGSGTAPDTQFGSGNQTVSDAGTLTKTGFRFAGWYTNANRTGGTAYAVGSTYNLAANATLYAVWIANVTYDANGADTGTVGTDATEYIPGSTVTITASSPTLEKTGATFAGWNTAPDGSGTSYPISGTFTIPGDVTLYAKWTVTLAYNANGGTGAVPATTTQLLNATPAVSNKTNAMTNGVQNFIGWNTAADGSGAEYFVGGNTDPLTANTILYAEWTNSPVYTITYLVESATSGSAPTDPRNYLGGTLTNLASNTGSLARTGYTFNGWSCNSVNYSEGASITIGSANIVCTPRWNEIAPSGGGSGGSGGSGGGGNVVVLPIITFDPNYPNGPAVTQQGGSGEVTLLPNTYKRPGYKFKGWSRNAAGPVQILDGGKLTVTENLTLYAIWEEEPVVTPVTPGNPVTITFNSNCAPRIIEKQTNAGKVKLNSNTFTCPSYAFAGWSTSPTGSVDYLDKAIYNFASPATLYAVWVKSAVVPTITKGEYRFEVFFDMNSIVITSVENKNIANHIALIKKKAGANASYKVVVEGWVQPNPKPGNIKYLSEGRAKRVAALMRTLGLKATYKELYKGLGADNMPKARHASVIVTWTSTK